MKWPKRSLEIVMPLRQGAIMVGIIAVLFTFSYVLVDRYVVRQKMGDLMNLADTKYVHILDFLDLTKGITRDRADSATIREALTAYEKSPSPADQAKIEAEVEEVMAIGHMSRKHAFGRKPLTRDRFHESLVTDDKGRVVASTKKSDIGESLAKTAMWRVGRHRTGIIDPFRASHGDHGEILFAVVSPIYAEPGAKGRVIGTFINKVDTRLLTMIMNAELGNIIGGKLWFAGFQWRSLDLYIMDKKGRYITQSRLTGKNTVLAQQGSELPWRRAMETQAGGDRVTNVGISTGAREAMDIYTNRAGFAVAGASMPIFDQGWTVVVEQQTQDAFASVINLERALIVGGILTAFLAGLASWASLRRVTNSLASLNTASVKLASGNLDTTVDIAPNEYIELVTLAGSFNIMKDNLRKNLASLNQSNERLRMIEVDSKRTIDDLLEFIHPSELTLREDSLESIVEDALPFAAVPQNIVIEKDYDQSLAKVEADRPKLLQAVANIISRAVQSMPEGGRLTIKTAVQKNQVQISIADTGAGIDPQDIAKMFEPTFSALDSKLGLALPVARRYIEQHGGTISLSAREGPGTSVDILLPMKARKAA